jgi:hypothetical protein
MPVLLCAFLLQSMVFEHNQAKMRNRNGSLLLRTAKGSVEERQRCAEPLEQMEEDSAAAFGRNHSHELVHVDAGDVFEAVIFDEGPSQPAPGNSADDNDALPTPDDHPSVQERLEGEIERVGMGANQHPALSFAVAAAALGVPPQARTLPTPTVLASGALSAINESLVGVASAATARAERRITTPGHPAHALSLAAAVDTSLATVLSEDVARVWTLTHPVSGCGGWVVLLGFHNLPLRVAGSVLCSSRMHALSA